MTGMAQYGHHYLQYEGMDRQDLLDRIVRGRAARIREALDHYYVVGPYCKVVLGWDRDGHCRTIWLLTWEPMLVELLEHLADHYGSGVEELTIEVYLVPRELM